MPSNRSRPNHPAAPQAAPTQALHRQIAEAVEASLADIRNELADLAARQRQMAELLENLTRAAANLNGAVTAAPAENKETEIPLWPTETDGSQGTGKADIRRAKERPGPPMAPPVPSAAGSRSPHPEEEEELPLDLPPSPWSLAAAPPPPPAPEKKIRGSRRVESRAGRTGTKAAEGRRAFFHRDRRPEEIRCACRSRRNERRNNRRSAGRRTVWRNRRAFDSPVLFPRRRRPRRFLAGPSLPAGARPGGRGIDPAGRRSVVHQPPAGHIAREPGPPRKNVSARQTSPRNASSRGIGGAAVRREHGYQGALRPILARHRRNRRRHAEASGAGRCACRCAASGNGRPPRPGPGADACRSGVQHLRGRPEPERRGKPGDLFSRTIEFEGFRQIRGRRGNRGAGRQPGIRQRACPPVPGLVFGRDRRIGPEKNRRRKRCAPNNSRTVLPEDNRPGRRRNAVCSAGAVTPLHHLAGHPAKPASGSTRPNRIHAKRHEDVLDRGRSGRKRGLVSGLLGPF